MSDLCAPIYVVLGADDEMTFWCFVEVMERMVGLCCVSLTFSLSYALRAQKKNFQRDQSGMKKQLSTLQQLIAVMDPELYRHLGKIRHPFTLLLHC
jgi:TBC1 domain family member 15